MLCQFCVCLLHFLFWFTESVVTLLGFNVQHGPETVQPTEGGVAYGFTPPWSGPASGWNVWKAWWIVPQCQPRELCWETWACPWPCPLPSLPLLLLAAWLAACLWVFFLLFIRRFWNQILICLSVRLRFLASSHLKWKLYRLYSVEQKQIREIVCNQII